MDKTILDKVYSQVLAELPQIMNEGERHETAKDYINHMSNYELLELLERSL